MDAVMRGRHCKPLPWGKDVFGEDRLDRSLTPPPQRLLMIYPVLPVVKSCREPMELLGLSKGLPYLRHSNHNIWRHVQIWTTTRWAAVASWRHQPDLCLVQSVKVELFASHQNIHYTLWFSVRQHRNPLLVVDSFRIFYEPKSGFLLSHLTRQIFANL